MSDGSMSADTPCERRAPRANTCTHSETSGPGLMRSETRECPGSLLEASAPNELVYAWAARAEVSTFYLPSPSR
eukprot:scaffold53859_cov30-Phaeocystis_antarctica.AAC.2